jgi:hypothetical protein
MCYFSFEIYNQDCSKSKVSEGSSLTLQPTLLPEEKPPPTSWHCIWGTNVHSISKDKVPDPIGVKPRSSDWDSSVPLEKFLFLQSWTGHIQIVKSGKYTF